MVEPSFNLNKSIEFLRNEIPAESSLSLTINSNPSLNVTSNVEAKNLLLPHLTKISHEDYIGKDLCVHCHKLVAKNHQALSCDKCERWTHRACTYIDIQKYRTLKQYSSFPWLCKNCKPQSNDLGDICEVYLDASEMPESLEYFKDKNI